MSKSDDPLAELAARRQNLDELRREIQIGVDEIDRGKFAPLDLEEIKRKGRALLRQQLKDDRSN